MPRDWPEDTTRRPVDPQRLHLAFQICSPACVAALEAAIAGDNLISGIH